MHRCPPVLVCSIASSLALAAIDCGGDGFDVPQPQPCAPSVPVFLRSQVDDDDGDGNPHDEQFPVINDEDDDIADHAWIRDASGVYHLFFHNEGQAGGSGIEHYVSRDLEELEYVGVALRPNRDGWDSAALWAPYVVASDGVYWMFYTGTTAVSGPAGEQRIGLARSEDLVQWTRVAINRCQGTTGDGCVYDCNEAWTAWGGPMGPYDRQCRDPFVIWDAAAERWVLFATAKSTNEYGVVTVAYANDLSQWVGAGYVNATRKLVDGVGAQRTGGQAENPFVMQRDGTFYLLFTDWRDPEDSCTVRDPRTLVQYATATTLEADPDGSHGWLYRGSTPDPGVNAIEVQQLPGDRWIMSQSISNPASCDEPEHRRELRLKRIVWGAGGTFTTVDVLACPGGSKPKSP